MNLKVLLPSEVFLDCQVLKLTAEAPNGFFCLLPRHIDFVATIVPGILSFLDNERLEHFVAVDEGTLVKCGPQVLVSTRHAVMSMDLGQLQQVVEQQFESIDERERLARSAAARLESGMVRRFMDLEKRP
ncbi:F0F1 ATP synthase subunit epsilon [Bremerella sp. T1]|uniref:F0F1 ATP synthase subunit epsilon n=1 Tax=Bremerella sp. TYQ1 TaxID=3119568 RepID=UPI001CCE766B|nr:F0F1 ATP synthase subunit epsilon [Bremerella volcania]UBM36386.1 F0F1 ATP synthase subunit epsilon [Bremerella volcania]